MLRRWYRAAPESIEVAPETTFRLSEHTYLEPDVILFDRATGLPGLSAATVHLVVEIADSSLRYDIIRKAALYASFGIRELWVIDEDRATTRLFRSPVADRYNETLDISADATAKPVFVPDVFALRLTDLDIAGS